MRDVLELNPLVAEQNKFSQNLQLVFERFQSEHLLREKAHQFYESIAQNVLIKREFSITLELRIISASLLLDGIIWILLRLSNCSILLCPEILRHFDLLFDLFVVFFFFLHFFNNFDRVSTEFPFLFLFFSIFIIILIFIRNSVLHLVVLILIFNRGEIQLRHSLFSLHMDSLFGGLVALSRR